MSDLPPPELPPATFARLVVEAVTGVAGVVALDGGALGEFATFGRGQRVAGVQVRPPPTAAGAGPTRVRVRIVAAYGERLDQLAERVRGTVREVAGTLHGLPEPIVDVDVVDVRRAEVALALTARTSPSHDAPALASSDRIRPITVPPAAPPVAVRPPDVDPGALGRPPASPDTL